MSNPEISEFERARLAKAAEQVTARRMTARQQGGLVRGITVFIHCLVLVIWSVIGLLLWIPFLTRMILVFTAAIMATIYKNSDPTKAERGLQQAITFYIRGFEAIMSSMRGDTKQGAFEEVNEAGFFRVLMEVGFAISFWVGIVLTWYFMIGHGWARVSSFEWPTSKIAVASTNTNPAGPSWQTLLREQAGVTLMKGLAVSNVTGNSKLQAGDKLTHVGVFAIKTVEDAQASMDYEFKHMEKTILYFERQNARVSIPISFR